MSDATFHEFILINRIIVHARCKLQIQLRSVFIIAAHHVHVDALCTILSLINLINKVKHLPQYGFSSEIFVISIQFVHSLISTHSACISDEKNRISNRSQNVNITLDRQAHACVRPMLNGDDFIIRLQVRALHILQHAIAIFQ